MPDLLYLDWSKTGSAGEPAPCVICGKPAICRSPRHKPVHKTCADLWDTTRSTDRRAA